MIDFCERHRIASHDLLDVLEEIRQSYDFGELSGNLVFATPHNKELPKISLRLPLIGTPEAWLQGEEPHELQLFLLVQAGAVALGLWKDSKLVAHKAMKKYVVRGRGRAQPTHLKTRGKSRYGSRLRLQNANRLQAQTIEKIAEWKDTFGEIDSVFLSATPRLWSNYSKNLRDLLPESITKIPLDVRVPCYKELLRVRRIFEYAILAPCLEC